MMKFRVLLTWLLVCIACVALPVCANAAGITLFQKTLAKDGESAAWGLITPDYHEGSDYQQEGYSELRIWSPDSPVMPYLADYENAPPLQTSYRVYLRETNGTGFTIEQIDVFFANTYEFRQDTTSSEQLTQRCPMYVPAYGTISYGAGCPAFGNARYEIIVASGVDDNGHEQEFYGVVERLNSYRPTELDGDYDTQNLRYAADYEVNVAENVWWVPAVALGGSDYTNAQIAAMVNDEPGLKQEKLDTLYEALQLFQVGNFYGGDDNVRIVENGIDWEHHKPGYHAVRTNNGCCSTDSNWLNYILRDDYEQVGFMAYSQADGSGHIFNYIFHEGYYYFIDLTHYRTDFLDSSAIETGNIGDYRNSDFVAGNLHKAASPEEYVRYIVESYNDAPELFFLYQAEDCATVTSRRENGNITILYPDNLDVQMIRGNTSEPLDYEQVVPATKQNDWTAEASAVFEVDAAYLSEENSLETLSAYQPGDVIELVDCGKQGFAEIDQQDYLPCKTDLCRFLFESSIALYGGNIYSYISHELPLQLHEQLNQMESVKLGDMAVEFAPNLEDTEIVIAVREGDTLLVTDVLRNQPVYETAVYATKDENGIWQDTSELWFLLHYELDGELQREFGRFWCGCAQ